MKPRILLTCGSVTEKSSSPSGEVPDRPKTRTGLLAEYVRCVALAGGAPLLLLPNTDDSEAVAASFEVADGLLLTGGWDIHPAEYLPGDEVEPAVGKCGGTDRRRDRTERMACLAAMARGLPILGICRGSQMLNVAMGGSLIPHVPDRQALRAGASAVNHRADHAARFEPGSVIAGLWAGLDRVNSSHHQAVDRVADGLRATAWAPDGVIECVESADGAALLGVQSHPERLAEERAVYLSVFRWLVAKAGA